MIVILWFLLICLFLLLYIVHKKDILYPSVVLCVVYLLFITCTFYVWDKWGMGDYSFKAAGLIFLAVIIFALVGIMVEKILFARKNYIIGESSCEESEAREINISKGFIIISTIICVVSLLWYLQEVRRISGGGRDWTSMLEAYRYRTHKQVLDLDEQMPFILRQITKVIIVQGYFCCCVLANNITVRKIRAKDFGLILLIVISCIQVIFGASRMEILKYIACFFVVLYIMWHRKKGWNRNLSLKFVFRGTAILIIFIGAFYIFRGVVGRTTEKDFLEYTAIYTGGPIKLFDMYIQSPYSVSTVWGGETFYSLNEFIMRFTKGGITFRRALEFRSYNGFNVGNVYSAIRRYYNDFGIAGVVIFVAITSFVINYMYCKVKYSKHRKLDFPCMIYGFLFFVVPLFPYEDYMFSIVLSVNYAIRIILLYLFYYFFILNKVRLKRQRRIKVRINEPQRSHS